MKFIPHAYQSYCINRLLVDEALGLFLDMGLGKTVITLTGINDLKYNRFAISKVLVIAPKKVAEATWAKEAAKWDHLKMLRVTAVLGSQAKRIRALNTPADIYVINRENVQWLVDYYRNSWPFDMVVVDEFSSFKNHQAKRFKSLSWVRKHITRFVGLTGTPAPNGLLDLWAQVFLLDGGQRLGTKISHFRERYFEPDQRDRDHIFSYAPKPGADDVIRQLIGDICVSMKAEDYLELPDIIYNTVPVVLDSKANTAYEKLEREMLLEIDETTIDAGSAAVLTNKLLQLCNGAVYDENREIVEIHHCKLEAFLELIEGLNGQPVLVFYNFQHDLLRIKKALEKSKLKIRELKGPQDETDWNDRKIDILLAHPASCAYGLNLQKGGNHVIWFGLNWSLELYQQANKRLHRQGQTEKVIIHHLVVEGGVDEDVITALEDKGSTQDSLMNALKARIKKVSENGA
ncbi:DEAD/DEAH box helicase [Petroclostridium sp. X23]|uniref:DEAD/DEAH box helicase n=1 Tax=Petroclostridium sp. X23 TaxID=3045146 RepID=UPI0024ADBB35|nr:DEAD/DEAH box helicase [Petroclostridium sp. X23]WHH58466.1 DEAD/DEAH box helicase [Petroclostridium sp. X23]